MYLKAFPYIGLLGLFWGSHIVVARFSIGDVDPYLFTALRLSIALLFFVPIFLIQKRAWPTDLKLWAHASFSGLIGVAIPMTLFISSLQYQSSGMTSIFTTISPALIAIGAHYFLPDEKISYNKACGVILALAGSLFLVLRGESGLAGVERANLLGFTFATAAICFDAGNTIFVRRRMRGMDSVTVTGIRLFVGALITIILAMWMSDLPLADIPTDAYFSIAYSGVIGALGGQFLAFYITRRFGATAVSLTPFWIPVVATALGVLLLDEIVTWGMFGGVMFIFSGIYLINRQVYST